LTGFSKSLFRNQPGFGTSSDFSKTEKEKLLMADIEAFNGKYEKLIQILKEIIL
jgi:hypothetical protein